MPLDIPNLTPKTNDNDLINACHKLIEKQGDNSEGRTLQLNYLLNVLNIKYQEKLLKKQNNLVVATWVLAIVTILLAIVTYSS